MPRPTVICHMISSLDGRLLPDRWPVPEEDVISLYDDVAERLEADGWIAGRNTMANYVPSGEPAPTAPPRVRADHIAGPHGGQIAICFDRFGRLSPKAGLIDGDHLVIVLSERVCDAHVETLVAHGVSVFFAGPEGTDMAGALDRIAAAFGSRRLLLEGGGTINGVFLAAGLIDETSTIVLPVIDGRQGSPTIYEQSSDYPARALELIAAQAVGNGAVWLRHRVLPV